MNPPADALPKKYRRLHGLCKNGVYAPGFVIPEDVALICEDALSLLSDLETACEALEFYEDKDNWDLEDASPTIWDDGQIDCGNRAIEALEKIRGKK